MDTMFTRTYGLQLLQKSYKWQESYVDNDHNIFAVSGIVGHMPREISRVIWYFLEGNNTITPVINHDSLLFLGAVSRCCISSYLGPNLLIFFLFSSGALHNVGGRVLPFHSQHISHQITLTNMMQGRSPLAIRHCRRTRLDAVQ